MTKDEMFRAVMSSKAYGGVCAETVSGVIDALAPRYKSDKMALKAVKSRLREITGAFVLDADMRLAQRRADAWGGAPDAETLRKDALEIMSLHASTRERLPFFMELIGDIRGLTGFGSVFDAGCGFNPFFLPFLDCRAGIRYTAMDINLRVTGLVGRLFDAMGVEGTAIGGDLLVNMPKDRFDCAFLFKLLPLLERIEKGAARRALCGINAGFLAVTFPTRSLSGRNVGMEASYRDFIRGCAEGFSIVLTRTYSNETLYVLSR